MPAGSSKSGAKGRLAALTFALVAVAASPGRAEVVYPSVKLSWSAPFQCPTETDLVRRVEEFLGQSLAATRDQKLTIAGVVRRDGELAYQVTLKIASARGVHERRLDHADCERLAEATALVVALAIDPELVKARQLARQADGESKAEAEPTVAAPPPEPEPESRPPAVLDRVEPKASVMPADAPDRSQSPRTDSGAHRPPLAERGKEHSGLGTTVALTGLIGGGNLPRIGTGAGLELALGLSRIQGVLLGRYWLSRDQAIWQDRPATVSMGLTSVGARVCGLPLDQVWSLRACLGPEFGDMAGRGEGVDRPRTQHDRWSSLIGSVGLAYGERVRPIGGVELAWAFERPRFGILQDGQNLDVFRPSPWAVQGYLGLGIELD